MKLDDKKYTREAMLMCPTCGNNQFKPERVEASTAKCAGCGLVLTKESLFQENGENINDIVNEIKTEVIKDFREDFREILKKSLGKNFTAS